MRLDVGCGIRPTGDVNCDLYVGRTPHRSGIPIIPKNIPNFVKCDVLKLPFKNSCFEEVYSSHVLEHVTSPTRALLEMLRVSKRKIIFKVPHRYARLSFFRYKQHQMHRHFFNVRNMKMWLGRLNLSFDIRVEYRGFPHPYVSIINLPWEIIVEIYKLKPSQIEKV